MPVDEIEEQEITRFLLWNAAKEALDFSPLEILDRFLIVMLALRHAVLFLRTAGDSNAFPHLRSVGRKAEEGDPSESAITSLFCKRRSAPDSRSLTHEEVDPMPSQRGDSACSDKTPKRAFNHLGRTKSAGREANRRLRIGELFLQREESYGLSEAARIVGISTRTLRREAEDDQREAYRSNGTWRFTWRQVAFIAMRRWTLLEIHEALGTAAETVLPPLLALDTLTVRLPAFLVRAMKTAAEQDAMPIDDWLRLELIDYAGTVVDEMEAIHPGFRQAYLFPGRE